MGVPPAVLPFRRKRSWKRRVSDAARNAPQRGRDLRAAASQMDMAWARSWLAGVWRENFLRFVLRPAMDFYAARRATGRERLAGLKGRVILVANHASHMDTPVILAALPRKLRKRTAVAAAADYFYQRKAVAWLVSLLFNTVPMDRKGWGLLVYPEGTRRGGGAGRVRRGAAVLANRHKLPVVPIRVSGTRAVMPPG